MVLNRLRLMVHGSHDCGGHDVLYFTGAGTLIFFNIPKTRDLYLYVKVALGIHISIEHNIHNTIDVLWYLNLVINIGASKENLKKVNGNFPISAKVRCL